MPATEQDFLACVHCGLCTSACPTYLELRSEPDSPRGRIHLLRALADGRLEWTKDVVHHLDICLDCRACMTACPSGVQYGPVIEAVKEKLVLEKRTPWMERLFIAVLRNYIFPYPKRLRLAVVPARIVQRIPPLARLISSLPYLGPLMNMLPPSKPSPKLPAVTPAVGEERHRVALLTGCVGTAMFQHVNAATVRVLARNGCRVLIPHGQVCCGAMHAHTGAMAGARKLALRNIAAFEAALGGLDKLDAILVNAAGCGSTLKEYADMLAQDPANAERARLFSAKVRDISEFLATMEIAPPTKALPVRVTYHDACHLLHGQGISQEPRDILSLIPGLELVPLPETEVCCGSAGIYNLVHVDMANRLLRRKVENIRSTGARIVAAGNPGCALQIMSGLRQAGLDVEVVHPIELLDRAYSISEAG